MKKSPVYPKHEIDYCNSEYTNLHADFSQFLDEAKQSERGKLSSPEEEDVLDQSTEREQEKRKKKKPWKAFVFPWLRSEKKNKKKINHYKPETELKASSRGGSNTSGPVFGGGAANSDGRARRALSGPIMSSLFSPMKKARSDDVPYVCLGQLGKACADDKINYGPVYLVT